MASPRDMRNMTHGLRGAKAEVSSRRKAAIGDHEGELSCVESAVAEIGARRDEGRGMFLVLEVDCVDYEKKDKVGVLERKA